MNSLITLSIKMRIDPSETLDSLENAASDAVTAFISALEVRKNVETLSRQIKFVPADLQGEFPVTE